MFIMPHGGGFLILKQVKIEGLLFEQRSETYILLLKEIDGSDSLQMWIGKPEAESIALVLAKVNTPRPLSHDLIKNILGTLNVEISKVVITDIADNIYYANLYLLYDGDREIPVDSRPSDAIAVALRVNAPIFVDDGVFSAVQQDELKEWLGNIKPEDFDNIV